MSSEITDLAHHPIHLPVDPFILSPDVVHLGHKRFADSLEANLEMPHLLLVSLCDRPHPINVPPHLLSLLIQLLIDNIECL